jgi:hypothetical protein
MDAKQRRPDDTNWNGAEIKSCCRLAALLDVPLACALGGLAASAAAAAA